MGNDSFLNSYRQLVLKVLAQFRKKENDLHLLVCRKITRPVEIVQDMAS